MNTANCNIASRPGEVTGDFHIANGRYKNEVIIKMAGGIIGAALWTGVWVVSLGYIVGWLRF